MAEMHLRVHDGLGNVDLIIEDDSPGVRQTISRFSIPDEIAGRVAVLCARRALHNRKMSDEDKDFLRQLVDAFIPPAGDA